MAKRRKRNGSKNQGEGLQDRHKVGQACGWQDVEENCKDVSREETSRKGASPHTKNASSAVETAVIAVVDEPIPGVMRVTEIEESRVTSPDPDDPMSSDIPEPDSLGG
jgi:hypothetical protein